MRTLARASGLLILLAHAASTLAQTMYRCERDGRLSFSDMPCESGAKTAKKDYASPSAGTGSLDFQVVTRTYPVEGLDFASLAQSLSVRGPRGFHGLTQWRVGYEYTSVHEGNLCRISTVLVKISGEILMPQWVNAASAPPALQRHWSDYYAALKRHEDGHVQHGRELALLVRARLLALGAVPCEQLADLARGEYEQQYASLRNRDKEYDARTNHGATQGAHFGPPQGK